MNIRKIIAGIAIAALMFSTAACQAQEETEDIDTDESSAADYQIRYDIMDRYARIEAIEEDNYAGVAWVKIKNEGTPPLTVKDPVLKISSDKGFAMDTKNESIDMTKKVIKTGETTYIFCQFSVPEGVKVTEGENYEVTLASDVSVSSIELYDLSVTDDALSRSTDVDYQLDFNITNDTQYDAASVEIYVILYNEDKEMIGVLPYEDKANEFNGELGSGETKKITFYEISRNLPFVYEGEKIADYDIVAVFE